MDSRSLFLTANAAVAYTWIWIDLHGGPLVAEVPPMTLGMIDDYRLHQAPNIPVRDFWSVIVYDNQTRSMLQTDQQFPQVSSQDRSLMVNPDGSVDVHFGAKAPAGREHNWVQTVPGKGWNMLFRLYGPLEPWFNKTWRLNEIELVK
jgi:hypothetical protein